MTSRKQGYDQLLLRVAENLDISDTMRDKAIKSYTAVGLWLGDCSDDSSVKIFPQGSFYLGTVVKPIDDQDEYDIDLVCLLKDKYDASESEIKTIVGNRLKQHGKYVKMMDKKEGKRCWTLHYDEFHMDILPSVPAKKVYEEPDSTGIRLTNKDGPNLYSPRYSNPYKYHEWFESRMRVQLDGLRKSFAARNQVDISEVPLYAVKTPLQRTIQILKRHRDIMYQELPDVRRRNAPISIIITTLAAHAYKNESNVTDALSTVLENMQKYIEIRGGQFWIPNPAMPEENFADKWNEDPSKQREFADWLVRARDDLIGLPLKTDGYHKIGDVLKRSLGDGVVTKSLVDLGNEMKLSRDESKLYLAGLRGGLTTTPSEGAKRIGGHTFFGK